jgi:hypothetical protein
MTIEKNMNGFWVISDIVDGYLVTRRYMDYTKKEAVAMFKAELRGMI